MLNVYFHLKLTKIEEVLMCKVNLFIHSNLFILFKLNLKNLSNYSYMFAEALKLYIFESVFRLSLFIRFYEYSIFHLI